MAYTEIMQQRDSKMAIKFLTKSSGYRICLWDNKVKTQYKNRFQYSSPFSTAIYMEEIRILAKQRNTTTA